MFSSNWAEKKLDGEEFEEIFGKANLSTRERVNVVLGSKRITEVRKYSNETKIPISRLIDEAIDLLRQKREF